MLVNLELIGSVLFGLGVFFAFLMVFPTSFIRMAWMLIALVMFGASAVVDRISLPPMPTPTPTPTPTPIPPNPGPLPVPVGQFADQIRATFNGTPAEAQTIATLHSQFSEALAYDSGRSKIKDTNTLGAAWADAQRYRVGADKTPWATKFAQMESVCKAEMTRRQILSATNQQLDATRRATAVSYFAEVAQILNALYPGAPYVRDN